MTAPHDDRSPDPQLQIITDLGGARRISALCGVSESAVRMWLCRGRIPPKWQPLIAEAAVVQGVAIPAGFLRRQA